MKNFICKHKKLLMTCLLCIFVVSLCAGTLLTASAFVINTNYTVEYGSATATSTQTSVTYDIVYAYDKIGTVDDFGIVINGQVYGNANIEGKTITVNKLVAGTVADSTGTSNNATNRTFTSLYYKIDSQPYLYDASTGTEKTGKNIFVEEPLVITTAGTYQICVIRDVQEVGVVETTHTYTRSAFLTVVVNPNLEIPVPEKTGYTFTGWYTDEACTNLFEEDYFSSDMVLYAGFRPNQYTIVFNGNGHTSGSMSNLVCDYGTSYNLTTNSFVKTGYEFLGWSQTQSATTATYTDESSIKNLSSTDGATINLYAVWKASTYTVIFQGPTSNYTMTCTIDQEYTVYDGSALTKEGHTLTGYSIGENGPLGFPLGSTFMNIAQAGETVYLYTCFDVNQIYITFIIPGLNGEKDEVITIEVDWGTPTTDVISQNVDSLLLEVEDGQELPN